MDKKRNQKLKNKETHLPLEDAAYSLWGSMAFMVLLKIPWRSLWELRYGPLKMQPAAAFPSKNFTI